MPLIQPCQLHHRAFQLCNQPATEQLLFCPDRLGAAYCGAEVPVLAVFGEQRQINRDPEREQVGAVATQGVIVAIAVLCAEPPLGPVLLPRQLNIGGSRRDLQVQGAQYRMQSQPFVALLIGACGRELHGGFQSRQLPHKRPASLAAQPLPKLPTRGFFLLLEHRQAILQACQLQLCTDHVLLPRAPHRRGIAGLGRVHQMLEQSAIGLDNADTFLGPENVQPQLGHRRPDLRPPILAQQGMALRQLLFLLLRQRQGLTPREHLAKPYGYLGHGFLVAVEGVDGEVAGHHAQPGVREGGSRDGFVRQRCLSVVTARQPGVAGHGHFHRRNQPQRLQRIRRLHPHAWGAHQNTHGSQTVDQEVMNALHFSVPCRVAAHAHRARSH